MIKLRISREGVVQSLWADEIQWVDLGVVQVRRASHVEFDEAGQCWCVQEGKPTSTVRRWLQWLLRRSMGQVLHRAATRQAALAWEHDHFQPGGPGWRRLLT